jgi:hypothetical protein
MPSRVAKIGALGVVGILIGGSLSLVEAQRGTPDAAHDVAIIATYTLPDIPLADLQNDVLPDHPIGDDEGLFLGGVGSDLWHDRDAPEHEFWLVTDRGPNLEVEVEVASDTEERRTFPVPDFTPLILQVRSADGALTVLDAIPIINSRGEPVTGLSNLMDADETPFDSTGEKRLDFNQGGLDVEGLVRTADGEFWLADEYRPSLVHVNASGTVLERYVPEGVALPEAGYPVAATLPAIYDQRANNRGFEGLALSGDERTLYAVLQSPLAHPNEDAGEESRAGRILAIDVASGQSVSEYVYQFEDADEFDCTPDENRCDPDDMKLSGIVWIDEATLLVLERTDQEARLYLVDLSGASDILGSAWDDPNTSPSLEELEDPIAAGVTPLPKTLMVTLDALPQMPDKIEGVAVVDTETVAVINDNDFNVSGDEVPSQLLLIRVLPPATP